MTVAIHLGGPRDSQEPTPTKAKQPGKGTGHSTKGNEFIRKKDASWQHFQGRLKACHLLASLGLLCLLRELATQESKGKGLGEEPQCAFTIMVWLRREEPRAFHVIEGRFCNTTDEANPFNMTTIKVGR